jgi:hypothetical protein
MWRVGGKQLNHLHQQDIQLLAVPPGFFPLVVALKVGSIF